MTINTSIDRLRNTALILGILAAVPMAAQAMLTEHDTLSDDAGSSSSVVKRLSADADSALAARFGTYAGIPGKGSGQVRVEQFSVEPKGRRTNGLSEPTRWLP